MAQIIINGLIAGMSYALIALGLTLIFSIMNILNFAHGQMYMLGGFAVYYFYARFTLSAYTLLNYFFALIMCILILAVVGIFFERFLFRRVLRVATRDESSMLLAMGTALVLENFALLAFGEKQRGIPPVFKGVKRIFGAFLPVERLMIFVISFFLIIALLLFIRYTKPGRAMRALAQDKEATYLQGVNINKMAMLGFAIGAALAGVAGGLLAQTYPVYTGSGTIISIKSFLMIIIGGAGVVSGAILGGLILGMLEAIGYGLIPGSITYLLIFAAVILLLIIRPQGIMGKPWG